MIGFILFDTSSLAFHQEEMFSPQPLSPFSGTTLINKRVANRTETKPHPQIHKQKMSQNVHSIHDEQETEWSVLGKTKQTTTSAL